MRRFLLAMSMLGAASGAQAADMPDFLRGSFTDAPATRVNWQGFYVGGQVAYGSSNENFSGSNGDMLAALLQNRTINEMGVSSWNLGFGKESIHATAYGAFGGYNSQWDDVIVGLEASYVHGSFGGSAQAQQSLVSGAALSDNNYHNVIVNSTSSLSISDIATLRGRAGYAFGSYLPYMFGGVALGSADITRSVSVSDTYAPTQVGALSACTPPGGQPPFCSFQTSSQTQHGHLLVGYTGGLGIDVNLLGGLFLRAEWEYIRFATSVDTSINTARVGLGYKF